MSLILCSSSANTISSSSNSSSASLVLLFLYSSLLESNFSASFKRVEANRTCSLWLLFSVPSLAAFKILSRSSTEIPTVVVWDCPTPWFAGALPCACWFPMADPVETPLGWPAAGTPVCLLSSGSSRSGVLVILRLCRPEDWISESSSSLSGSETVSSAR